MLQNTTLKQIIGIDISKDTIDVRFGSIDTTQEKTISKSESFKNTPSGFNKLIEWKNKKILSENIPGYAFTLYPPTNVLLQACLS